MGDVQLDGDDAGAGVKGSGLAGPAVDAGTPAGELVGEVFSQPAVGSGDERRGLRQIHALAPWFAGEGHADLLQGSVPGVRCHRTLRLLRTRRMIFAGPAARLAGRALRRHDAACRRPAPAQTGNVTPVSSSETVHRRRWRAVSRDCPLERARSGEPPGPSEPPRPQYPPSRAPGS